MSESVSYNISLDPGPGGNKLRKSLSSRGMNFRDLKAWSSASQRAEELQQSLKNELEQKCLQNSALPKEVLAAHELEAMFQAFCKNETLHACARELQAQELETLHGKIEAVQQHLKQGTDRDSLAQTVKLVRRDLESLAARTQKTLCQAEKEAILATVSGSLHDLGYLVEVRGNAVKATHGHSCIWAEADAWGAMEIDISGFAGLSCLKVMKRLEAELKRQGQVMKQRDSRLHQQKEGGHLAQRLDSLFPVFRRMTSPNSQSRGNRRTQLVTGRGKE